MRGRLTELVEFQQYVLANFYHAFGINSNYNLKREQLNSSEIDVNKEVLRLNIEDLLKCREMGVSKINELYGLNIRVALNEEVYSSLLQEQEAFSGNRGSSTLPIIKEDRETDDVIEENSVETGEGENKDKQETDGDNSTNISDSVISTGENDGESGRRNMGSEETGEKSEIPEVQIQIEADNVEKIIIETDSNLSEKGVESDERPDSDKEHNTERMDDEKSGG